MQPLSRFARYFLAVAQHGSLRRAAEELHVSASAIDRQILIAEQDCETRLFERLPQGLRLTEAGQFLLADLQRWRKDHEQTLERLAELRGLRRGHVTIALIEALSEGFLPATLSRLRLRHPDLTFDLRVLRNSQIPEQLLSAQVEIGLLLDPESQRNLDCRGSLRFPLGLVTRPDHPLAGHPRLAPGDLSGLRLIVPADTLRVAGLSRHITSQAVLAGTQRTTCNDIRLIRSLVAMDQGVSILSQIDVAADLDAGVLRFTPFGGRHLKPLSLGVVVAPQRQLSQAALAVLQALTDGLDMPNALGMG